MADPRIDLLDNSQSSSEDKELNSWLWRLKTQINRLVGQIRGWMNSHLDHGDPTAPTDPHKQYAKWGGVWSSAKSYAWNTMVHDSGWLMIANKDTNERAAPWPIGLVEPDLPDAPAWSNNQHVGVVWNAHEFLFTKSGWITQLSVWVSELSESTNYRIIISDITIPEYPEIITIEEPVLTLDGWTTLSVGANPTNIGSKIVIILDSLNSGSDSTVTGGWTRGTDQNATGPIVAQWNRRTQDDVIRIHHTDADSSDRETELEGIIAGSDIQFVSTDDPNQSVSYHVNATTEFVTYVEYAVTRASTGIAGEPDVNDICTMTATVPVPQSTKYVELPNYWPTNQPSFATVNGLQKLSGVDQTVPDTAFGIRVHFQEATISEDWDYMAYSDLGVGETVVNQALIDEIVDIANHT